MKITINGEARTITGEDHCVLTLLETMKLDPAVIVVEINGNILSRDKYAGTGIQSGDKLELIRFMGGGCHDS